MELHGPLRERVKAFGGDEVRSSRPLTTVRNSKKLNMRKE